MLKNQSTNHERTRWRYNRKKRSLVETVNVGAYGDEWVACITRQPIKVYFLECYRKKTFHVQSQNLHSLCCALRGVHRRSIASHAICSRWRWWLRNKQASTSSLCMLRLVATCSGGSHKVSRLYMGRRLIQPSINQSWNASGQPRNSFRVGTSIIMLV